MIVIGLIEDQWQDLLKSCANFLIEASVGAEIQVKLYLVADESETPQQGEVNHYQRTLHSHHPDLDFPPLAVLSPLLLQARGKQLLERLASDHIDVIVSDSHMGDDEFAGLTLLQTALTERAAFNRNWTCHLITKHHECSTRWIRDHRTGSVDARLGFLDKKPLMEAWPRICCEDVRTLIDDELAAQKAANRMKGAVRFGGFIGGSKVLTEGRHSAYAIAYRANYRNSDVLIMGESGVGKDVLAHALHDLSPSTTGTFESIDCGRLNEQLIESELFGHVKGAFTGATDKYHGKVSKAKDGTLFLDEIHNMSLLTQQKLLRLIENREFNPVGSNERITITFRLIVATNKDLDDLVNKKLFLFDLRSRLGTYEIMLPPLRERRDDIAALTANLIEQENKRLRDKTIHIQPAAVKVLEIGEWPTNVRGLKQCINRAIDFALEETDREEHVTITPEHVHLALFKTGVGKSTVSRILPDPHPGMTPEEIWHGIRDHTLRRQSLPELRDLLGIEKVGVIIILAKNFIISDEGLNEFFPGTTPDNKRTIKSRSKRADTARRPAS